MTNSKNEDESSQDETKFSSPYVLNTDTSSSLGSDDGRTLWAIANTAPVSMALTESSASYAKRIRSGHLAHYSSSLRRTRKVYDTASASTVGAAAVETVTLSISSPKIPVASLSEINHAATEDSYHLGKSWNAGSTTSDWYSESMDSSAKMDREAESSSLFLTESVPLTDSTRKNAFSARQIITSFGQAQLLSHGIHSRKISSTSDITQLPDSSVGTSLTHSYFSRKTTAEDSPLPGSSSVTDRTVSGSSMESTERMLQALRDINTSYKATQISTASSDKVSSSDSHSTTKMDLSLGNTDLDEEMVSHFQADSEKIAVEDNNQPRSTFHIDRRVSSLNVDSGSISSLSGRDGERTSQTLRSGGAYHSATEMSTTINTNSSITVRLTDFSSKLTPVQTTQMDLLAGDSVNTEAAILHSQTPKATAVENNGLLKNSSNREKSVSTSHRKNVPTSGLSSRSEEMLLQTLEDMSNSYNATQISPVSSNELSSNLDFTDSSHALIPVQTSQMDLSGNGNARNNDPSAKTAAEDSDLLRWNTNTNQVVSNSEAENTSVSGISERIRERTLRTLRDVSSSLHALQRAATSSNEVFSSFGLTNSFSDIAAVETGQTDLPPGNTDVRNITPSEVTAVEDSSQLSSSSDRSSMTSGSASDLSDRGEERTLQMLRDISTSHKATQVSVVSGKEISSSSDFTNFTSVLTPVQAGQTDLSPELTVHIEGTVTESQPASETTAVEDRSLLKWSSHREKDVYSPESESVSVPGLFDKDRTLQTLNDISSFRNVAQKNPISSHETFSSLALTESSLLTLVQTEQVGDVEFTEATHVHSQPQSGITDVNGNQDFSTEKRDTQTESMFSVVPLVRSGAGTLSSLPNRNKSIDLMELSTSEDVSSSLSTQTFFSTAENGKEISPSTGIDITESLKDTLLTYSSKTSIYSPSALDLSNPGSSPQIDRLDAEGRLSSAATDSVYQSTVFTNGGVRTLRSLPDNSTSAVVVDSSTYESENSSSSEQTLPLMSVTEMEKHNVSLSEMQSTGPSTEHLFEYSSLIPMNSSSPKDSSTAGSSHHSSRSPSIPHSYTESTYTLSSFSYGDSVIKTTFTKATENPSLNMEKINSSEVNPFSPEVFSGQTDLSLNNLYVSSTETLQKLSSSRTPSYFFPSESSDTGTGYHPINSTDTEKKTSVSHTGSTYTSTIFTKGGERTLLSVLNSSASLDSSESSTFHAEISNPSEMTQSASYENESITSSLSDMDFSGPSTETLAVHSQKTSEYFSTVSKSHTTPFSSKSESTFSNSFSFTSSLPTSLKQDSYPPTQPSTLFLLPETSFPPTLSSPPQTSPVTFSHRLPSAAAPPSSSVSSSSLQTSVSSSSSQLSGSLETSISVGAPEGTTGRDPHTTVRPYSDHNHQTKMYVLKDSTFLMSTGPSPLLTETTEQLTSYSSPITISLEETKTSKGQNVSLLGSNSEKSIPILATSPMYFPESTMVSETAKATTPTLLSTNTLKDIFNLVETTRKKRNETTYTTLRMPTLVAGGDILVSMKPHKDTPSSTKTTQSTGMPTRGTEKTSTTTTVVQKHIMTTTQPAIMVSSGKTSKEALSVSPVSTKTTTVIWFGSTKTFSASPGKDVDECLHNPCPSLASCVNTQGSFYCTCSLGYWMEKGKCSLVRTFIGQFPLLFNTTGGKYSEPHHIEEGIINLLNDSLSTLPGYYTSAVKTSRHLDAIQVSVLSTFSLVSNVTLYDIVSAVRNHIRACKAPTETCHFISNLTMLHRVGGLCKLKDPGCDKETSMCVDFDGVAVCRCRPGYFKYNKLDLSCRACDDGYKLENDTCVSCPFGLGGFNCGNPYQLITIVIAAAGGGLLLIMGIALIVTCCQKNKNDISKLIFKSGDFQMSPYAEYPKNPRAQDWGRETIEMQENGSTKNLLQMTDVYYMPTNLRNPELERNGIYPPYTGLPGSRHSCIYPGQYNPSFISDDSRRRDYF